MILHLVPALVWDAVRHGAQYSPDTLPSEGFVHCTGDDATLVEVANRFYAGVDGSMVVLGIDETALTSPVRWEPPAHPDGRRAADDEPLFPHVYGPIDIAAVVEVRTMHRDDSGTYHSIS